MKIISYAENNLHAAISALLLAACRIKKDDGSSFKWMKREIKKHTHTLTHILAYLDRWVGALGEVGRG